MDNIKAIKRFPIFKNIDESDISALLRCFNAKIINIEKNTTFIKKDNRIVFLYIIISGLAIDIDYDDEGNMNIYNTFSDNDIVGLLSYSSGKKTYPRDIIAKTDIKALVVDAYRFINPCQNYCPRHVKTMSYTIDSLGRQSYKLTNRICELTSKTTREKFLLFLLNLSIRNKNKTVTIPYTHQELASYLGVERSSLSYEISKLKKEGYIDYDKRKYTLLK